MTEGAALIKTRRLTLRTYHAGMVTDQHIGWLNDPDVVRYSEQRHKKHTLESQHEYLNNLWKNTGSYIWMISRGTHVDTPQIGTITAHVDLPNHVANMGIMVGEKQFWGNGYGFEAWEAVIDFLRLKYKVHRIEAGMMASNGSMRRICEKARMSQNAVMPSRFVLDGKPEDMVLYGKVYA